MKLASNATLQPFQVEDQGGRVFLLALEKKAVEYPSVRK